jgi:hypothetical protein
MVKQCSASISSKARPWVTAGLLSVGVLRAAAPALAYGTDVHFNLTYIEARLAGIARNDALWISLADESIDHNRSTSAYSGTIETAFQFLGLHRYIWARNGERWQAYTDVGAAGTILNGVLTTMRYADPAVARAAIFRRRDELWSIAAAALRQARAEGPATQRIEMIRADIALGEFLHDQQDLYAHRQFGPSLDGEDWQPYGIFRGHSSEGYSPDYVALRPHLAREMLFSSYRYCKEWQQQRRGAGAEAISPGFATSLIAHMSAAYDSRALQYPNHRFRAWFPSQRELNRQLTIALAAFPRKVWELDLPNANEINYWLPYDQPATPLTEVEQHVGEPLPLGTRAPLPFSAVLTDELLRP